MGFPPLDTWEVFISWLHGGIMLLILASELGAQVSHFTSEVDHSFAWYDQLNFFFISPANSNIQCDGFSINLRTLSD